MPKARKEETAQVEDKGTQAVVEAPTNEFEEAAKEDAGTPKVVKKTALLKNVEDFLKETGFTEAVSIEEKTIQTAEGKNQYVVVCLDGGKEAVKEFLLNAALLSKVGYEKIGYEILDDTAEGEPEPEYVIVFHSIKQ